MKINIGALCPECLCSVPDGRWLNELWFSSSVSACSQPTNWGRKWTKTECGISYFISTFRSQQAVLFPKICPFFFSFKVLFFEDFIIIIFKSPEKILRVTQYFLPKTVISHEWLNNFQFLRFFLISCFLPMCCQHYQSNMNWLLLC